MTNNEVLELANYYFMSGDNVTKHQLLAFAHAIIAKTREEDAVICEDYSQVFGKEQIEVMQHCAAAIRGQLNQGETT